MSAVTGGNDWAAIEVLDALLADRERGEVLPVEHYLARFPGHEDLVRRLWKESAGGESTAVETAPPPGGATPARIGPYRLLTELGRGGQAVVFLAEDERLGRRVALKVLPAPALPGDQARADRLRREAALAARLDHPGIAAIYEAGSGPGHEYVAMRLVEGVSLARRLAGRAPEDGSGPPSLPGRAEVLASAALIEEAARAVHFAHEAGIVHRDLKPGNIMVTPEGRAVVLDFGLARDESEAGPALTATGDVLGTPAYMAPEQVRGERAARTTDVWALGVTLYECVTGRRAFPAPVRHALLRDVLGRDPPPARRENPSVPADLQTVLRTAMDKEPGRRYRTALDLAEDLRAVREGRPIAAMPPSPLTRVRLWARREPARAALVLALAAGILAAAAAAGWFLARLPDLRRGEAEARRDLVEAALQEGWLAAYERRDDAALAAFGRAEAAAPGDPEARAGTALCLRRRGSGAPEVLPAGEDRPPALRSFLAGTAALEAGNAGDPAAFAEAHLRFADAVAIAERARPVFHFYWALLAAKAGDAAGVERSRRAILALWPREPAARWVLGRAAEIVEPGSGLADFDAALAVDGAHVPGLLGRGDALLALRRFGEAEAAFRGARSRDPGSAEALVGIGVALVRQERAAEAVPFLKEAVALRPSSALAAMNLGGALLEAGAAPEAAASFEAAVALDPRSPLPRAAFAIAAARAAEGLFAEDPARARRIAASALLALKDGDDPGLRRALQEILDRER